MYAVALSTFRMLFLRLSINRDPSMAIADITAALEAAVKAAVEYEQDIKVNWRETLKSFLSPK